MKKVLAVFGTRPEAIKLSPVILFLERCGDFAVKTCATAQHRSLLDQVLEVFQIKPDYDLDLMCPGQTLIQSTARILAALEPVLLAERPDMILVQGDTTTTLCGALAGFYAGIPIGHVEAGLRTGDLRQPFPEEMNRVVAGRLAALHFAATEGAAGHLRAEGVAPERIYVTGNSGIDAVLHVKEGLESGRLCAHDLPALDTARKIVVVTLHRRESFGEGVEQVCRSLAMLAGRGDVQIVFPVHPNPHVSGRVRQLLGSLEGISLIDPLEYVSFVELMRRSHILITDSGGIQEEAPSLGKPVLVTRGKTERPEAVHAGTVKLVGADCARIVQEAGVLLDSPEQYARMAHIHNPYGDGQASRRIAGALREFFGNDAL
jgi:UDP-N-acetylglucosamine 2-epimerase (non-hydrolysing)